MPSAGFGVVTGVHLLNQAVTLVSDTAFVQKVKLFATAAQAQSVHAQGTVLHDCCFAKTQGDSGCGYYIGFVAEVWCFMQTSTVEPLTQKTADLESATSSDHAKQQVLSACLSLTFIEVCGRSLGSHTLQLCNHFAGGTKTSLLQDWLARVF